MKDNKDKLKKNKSSRLLRIAIIALIFILIAHIIFLVLAVNFNFNIEIVNASKVLIPPLITVIGVMIGFSVNRKMKYNEIVTQERINWLHNLQNNLARYLMIVSQGELEEQEKREVIELFNKIAFSLNYKERNHIKAIKKLYDYNPHNLNIKYPHTFMDENNKFLKVIDYLDDSVNKNKLQEEIVMKDFIEIFKNTWQDIKNETY